MIQHSVDDVPASERKMAVLFGWVNSQEKHLSKYASMYHARGVDTLLVLPKAAHVVNPELGMVDAAHRVLRLAEESGDAPLIIHGFSVGGFLYGQMLRCSPSAPLAHRRDCPDGVSPDWAARVAAQVFDSPVDFEGVPHGLSMAVFGQGLAQRLTETAIALYLALRADLAAEYVASSTTFKAMPVRAPALVVYSGEDDIADAGRIEEVMAGWQAGGLRVSGLRMDSSEHVQHLRTNGDVYKAAVNDLLDRAGL